MGWNSHWRAEGKPYADRREPGRLDVNGVEWWACDPYPTWYRWDGDVLRTNPARWADESPSATLEHDEADKGRPPN